MQTREQAYAEIKGALGQVEKEEERVNPWHA